MSAAARTARPLLWPSTANLYTRIPRRHINQQQLYDFKLPSPTATAAPSFSRLSSISRQFSSSTRTMAPSPKKYDYIVIGGGSGGSGTSRRAAGWYGKKVALISEGISGGCCVNVGCVPKKMAWNMASVRETMEKASRYAYDVPKNIPFDFSKFVEKRHGKIKQLNGIYENNWKKDGIELIHARATFVSDNELEITPNDGGEAYRITADHICIATGSYPTKPKDIQGSEHGITSDEYFEIKQLPKKMAFVGAGYIAVELAGVMQALGVETHLFIRGKTFLRKFDPMIQDNLTKHYEEMGVIIHKEHPGFEKVELLSKATDSTDPRQKELKLTSKDGSEIVVNELLWGIGRGAETRNLGLEKTGVKLDKTGHVIVDKFQNTTAKGIYAIGDITGQAELTPVAIAAGRHLSNRLFSGKSEYSEAHLNYENIPTVIFAHPPVGTVGLTEPEAVERYGKDNVKVYETQFSNMFYYVYDKDDQDRAPTAMKLIVYGEDERVAGIHVMGEGMDELAQGLGVAVKLGARKADFDSTVAIHPTSAEELVTMPPQMARAAKA